MSEIPLPTKKPLLEGVFKPSALGTYLDEYFETLGDGTAKLLGIETGFKEIDNALLGLSGLIVLGGVAGQGKTSLALQLAYDACEHGTPCIFYSLEMPRRAIVTKILSRLTGEKYTDILLRGKTEQMLGTLKECREGRLTKVADSFYVRSLEEKQEITLEHVEEEVNAVKALHNAQRVLVVVDHLQIVPIKTQEYRDQVDKENKLIAGFKGLHERTGSCVMLISQKNKAGFGNSNLGSIKGSVDITYTADVVAFLEEENEDMELPPDAIRDIKLVIRKNRYNAPKTISLEFEGSRGLFRSSIMEKPLSTKKTARVPTLV